MFFGGFLAFVLVWKDELEFGGARGRVFVFEKGNLGEVSMRNSTVNAES